MNNNVENWFFRFVDVKWLHLIGEVDKCVSCSCQILSWFNIPGYQKLKSVNFRQSYSKNEKVDVSGTQCMAYISSARHESVLLHFTTAVSLTKGSLSNEHRTVQLYLRNYNIYTSHHMKLSPPWEIRPSANRPSLSDGGGSCRPTRAITTRHGNKCRPSVLARVSREPTLTADSILLALCESSEF